jgi:hypothetical protein
MTREEIIAEMVRVAEALERPGLKPEQIIRGEKRYAELNALLDELMAREKAANDRPAQIPSEDSETPENGSLEPTDPAQKHLAKIWDTLGGRRKK